MTGGTDIPIPRNLLVESLLILLVGFTLSWVLAVPHWGGPGMTWDEAFYYEPFLAARDWAAMLLTNPAAALSAEGIRTGWEPINELPPVVKWLGALSTIYQPGGWWNLALLRIFPALAFAGTLVLLRVIALRFMPWAWAWLPVFLYAMHPRILAHGQLAATETVFAFVNLLVLWVALQDLRQWRWKAALAAAIGLALATKVNGIILLAIVLFWLATRRGFDRRVSGKAKDDLQAAALVLLAAPLVAFAIWPWMWDRTAERLAEYFRFITIRQPQGLWFLGQRWNFTGEPAPIWYPLLISPLTAPFGHLLLLLAGITGGLWRLGHCLRRRRHPFPEGPYLVALLMLGPIAAAMLPGTPRYDGIRLFFPAFAPAALVAAIGVFWLVAFLPHRRVPVAGRSRLLAGVAAGVFLLAMPGLAMQRPTIDYYNFAARSFDGGPAPFAFEQTYWGNAITKRAVDDLNRDLPMNARIKTLALQPLILEHYQEWGLLREDLQINPPPPYDAHLIQNRRGFWGNAEWAIFSMREPLGTWGRGEAGEPLLFLYDGRPPGM